MYKKILFSPPNASNCKQRSVPSNATKVTFCYFFTKALPFYDASQNVTKLIKLLQFVTFLSSFINNCYVLQCTEETFSSSENQDLISYFLYTRLTVHAYLQCTVAHFECVAGSSAFFHWYSSINTRVSFFFFFLRIGY